MKEITNEILIIKEEILSLVNNKDYSPLTTYEMLELFNNNGRSFEEKDFWRAVSIMEGEDFTVAFTKKGKLVSCEALGQYKGIYSASSKGGFGFVTTDKGEFFVPPSLSFCALTGDTVVCKKIDRGSR